MADEEREPVPAPALGTRAPEVGAPRRTGPNLWLWGCLGVPALLLFVGLALALFGWRSFLEYAVADDFTKFSAMIRKSDLSPEAQKPFLERLDRLREKARRDPAIGFWRWVDYQSSIKALIEDGRITPEEAEALDRELTRIEKEYR